MLTNSSNAPISKGDRIQYLDILRGMAILFILLANSIYFSGLWTLEPEELATFPTAQFDYIIGILQVVFVDGKWYSVFSILFGIGFAVQMHSMEKMPMRFPAFFRRRMFGLLLIGGIHLVFFWAGDILSLYALIGLLLIYFRNWPDRKLILGAGVLLCFPILNWLLIHIAGFDYVGPITDAFYQYEVNVAAPEEFTLLWAQENTSLLKFFQFNIGATLIRLDHLLSSGRVFKVLALFLIGLWAGRGILTRELLSNRVLLRKIALWGVLLGLPMNILRAFTAFSMEEGLLAGFLYELFYCLGTVPLACGYAALVALALPKCLAIFKPFAVVGRMALSNYLAQTIISIAIYYGIGMGFLIHWGMTYVWLLAIGIYIFQILGSSLWLHYFQFGPVEWVWRQLTYGKFIPLRRGSNSLIK